MHYKDTSAENMEKTIQSFFGNIVLSRPVPDSNSKYSEPNISKYEVGQHTCSKLVVWKSGVLIASQGSNLFPKFITVVDTLGSFRSTSVSLQQINRSRLRICHSQHHQPKMTYSNPYLCLLNNSVWISPNVATDFPSGSLLIWGGWNKLGNSQNLLKNSQ